MFSSLYINFPEAEGEDDFLMINSLQPHGLIPLALAIGKVPGMTKILNFS